VLHGCDSMYPFAWGQASPPLDAGVVIVNVCVCVPPPQETEQAPKEPNEPTQSTGQGCVLQFVTTGGGAVAVSGVHVCPKPRKVVRV